MRRFMTEAEQRITDSTTSIEDLTGSRSCLGTEIKNLQKEIAENQHALDQATAIRQKELAEFEEEEKDLLLSIDGLASAIKVLNKHNGASFLQVDIQGAVSTIQYQVAKNSKYLEGVITPTERKKEGRKGRGDCRRPGPG